MMKFKLLRALLDKASKNIQKHVKDEGFGGLKGAGLLQKGAVLREFVNLLLFGQLKPYLAKRVPGFVLSWNLLGSLGMCLLLNPEWMDHLISFLGFSLLALGFFAGDLITGTKTSYPLISPLLDNRLPIAILLVIIGNAGLFARIHKKFSSYVFVVLPIIIRGGGGC